jgi:hypothetical protein
VRGESHSLNLSLPPSPSPSPSLSLSTPRRSRVRKTSKKSASEKCLCQKKNSPNSKRLATQLRLKKKSARRHGVAPQTGKR